MRTSPAIAAAGLVLLGACTAEVRAPQGAIGAASVGAPSSEVDATVVGPAPASGPGGRRGEPIRMPDRIILPAAYRLLLLDGHLTLVRETDPQALAPAPTSMRIVMGEVARGELAFQPALLPQELAAEVASNRESSARMDNALETVMRRSRELSAQVVELEAESKRLAELLASARAAAPAPAPGSAAAAPAEPPDKPAPREPPRE
jgi:hypothetical protein